MAYEPTTTAREYKAAQAALSTLRSTLPRNYRACFGVSKRASSSRTASRYLGLATRLEKALKKA